MVQRHRKEGMMSSGADKIAALKAEFESKRQEFKTSETALVGKVESWKEQLGEIEERLRAAEWEAALETVETELKPLYGRERKTEAEIARCANDLFTAARKAADRINDLEGDVARLRQEIRSSEDRLIQAAPQDEDTLKEALAAKRAEAAGDLEVADYADGARALLRHLKVMAGHGDAESELFARTFGEVPAPIRNIYRAVTGSRNRLRIREDRLLMMSGITEPRIVLAREQLAAHLEQMRKQGLIRYDQEGDTYRIYKAGEPGSAGLGTLDSGTRRPSVRATNGQPDSVVPAHR